MNTNAFPNELMNGETNGETTILNGTIHKAAKLARSRCRYRQRRGVVGSHIRIVRPQRVPCGSSMAGIAPSASLASQAAKASAGGAAER